MRQAVISTGFVVVLCCVAGVALADSPAFLIDDSPKPPVDPRQWNCNGYSYGQPFDGSSFTTASTADEDPGYQMAESQAGGVPFTNLIDGYKVWGIEYYFDGTAWSPCTEAGANFNLFFYDGTAATPGTLLGQTVATYTQVDTAIPFAATTIQEYTLSFAYVPGTAGTVWIAVQRQDNADNCWFLMLNETVAGLYDDVANQGEGAPVVWTGRTTDYNFCVNESTVPVELQSLSAE